MSNQIVKGFNVNGSTVQYDYESLADRILKSSIASEYGSSNTYKVDDYVLYAGQLYRCIVEITTPQDFDSSKWEAVSAGSDLKWLKKYFCMNDVVKQTLLDCFAHCAWTDEHGQDYYDALESALYRATDLDHITAVFDQGQNIICTADNINELKQYLVVTAYYDDGTSNSVTNYTLIGTLTVGTSTITVKYASRTTTFDVTVRSATKLFVGASYGGNAIVVNAPGDMIMTTTENTESSYSCYCSIYGNASYFKTFGAIKGHRVRAYYTVTILNNVGNPHMVGTYYITNNITVTNGTRLRYGGGFNSYGNTLMYKDEIIPLDASKWGGSGTVTDSNYFTWRQYLLASQSGASVRVQVEFYDLGVDEQ